MLEVNEEKGVLSFKLASKHKIGFLPGRSWNIGEQFLVGQLQGILLQVGRHFGHEQLDEFPGMRGEQFLE